MESLVPVSEGPDEGLVRFLRCLMKSLVSDSHGPDWWFGLGFSGPEGEFGFGLSEA